MKPRILFSTVFVFIACSAIAWETHTGFTESAISTVADGSRFIYSADVDGDRDL
ncbi:MAG: hypothetical protein QGG04_00400 [Candidatus Marinimicrobia bacterium]|nr:hypothetical protein [Candidatus Neomarinimicrobiota bacterium]